MGDGDDEIWDEEGVELSVLLVDLGQGTRFGKVSVQKLFILCVCFVPKFPRYLRDITLPILGKNGDRCRVRPTCNVFFQLVSDMSFFNSIG